MIVDVSRTKVRKFKVRKRKRKFNRDFPGHVIRVSDDVWRMLRAEREEPSESIDSVLRRLFGMPDRRGCPQPLLEVWLEQYSGQTFADEADAKGAAAIQAARRKRRNISQHPIKLREIA